MKRPYIKRWDDGIEAGWFPFFQLGYFPGPYGQFYLWLGDLLVWYDMERPEWRWKRGR